MAFVSGTIGAATYAATYGAKDGDDGPPIPAIAFSGKTGSPTAYNADSTSPLYSRVYAQLAAKLIDTVVSSTESGEPILPSGVFLNVNFGSVSESKCANADDFHFVLTRMHVTDILTTSGHVKTGCGRTYLPSELRVSLKGSGCWASVSVAMAKTKRDANAAMQKIVQDKLKNLPLTCLK